MVFNAALPVCVGVKLGTVVDFKTYRGKTESKEGEGWSFKRLKWQFSLGAVPNLPKCLVKVTGKANRPSARR